MRFSQINGLEEVKEVLINSVITGHIAHAQLFLGPEGSANLALALAYAAYINCENKLEQDSCGACPSCIKIDKLVHPDLNFVMPVTSGGKDDKDSPSARFLNEWREFVTSNPYGSLNGWMQTIGAENKQGIISKEASGYLVRLVSLKAFEAEFKIVVIWLPELMHPNAANALLKLLEEPPAKTIFLLVASSSSKILPTILSRTQLVKVRPFSDEEVISYLKDNFEVEEHAAYQVAQLAEGNLNEAIQKSSEAGSDFFDFFREWMRQCFRRDFAKVIEMSEDFQKLGRENQKNFLHFALNTLRKVMLFGISSEFITYLPDNEMEFVKNFSKFIHPGNMDQMASELNLAHYHIERNANPKIIFTDSSIKIAGYLHLK